MKFSRALWLAVALLSSCREADQPRDAGCASDEVSCGSQCVSTSTDPAHCGRCNHACDATERCILGSCEARCTLAGIALDAGAVDPSDPCAQCTPANSTTEWSARPDGTSCAAQQICAAGQCASQCFIDGVLRTAMAVNPDDGCKACDPAVSTTSWSTRADGTTCAANEVCVAGVCQAKCFIDGASLAAGALDPTNPCQQCNPMVSTSVWSARSDGASCASGKVCTGGTCEARCFVGGTFYAPDAGSLCERCDPGQSTSAFTPAPDGTACGTGQVCAASGCAAKCFIGGVLYADGAVDPLNACQQCTVSNSTTGWSMRATGSSCGAGQLCEANTCVSKCLIDGGFFAADAVNPTQPCETCQPLSSTAAWTMRASVPLFVGGQDLAAQGWTVVSQQPFALDAGADFLRLATSTNSGAPTSGQLLITRAGVVAAGTPFTIRAEVLVESVSPHNALDSAAAFLGSFTPPFGTSTERSAMVYLDAAAIGWADNTQSAPLSVTNGQYRTYLFSVDATNTARLSVDGVPLLTRTGFVSNGTIALGDQTNDPNVDGVMRVRSVSRMCP